MKSAMPYRMSLGAVDPMTTKAREIVYFGEDEENYVTSYPFGHPINRKEVSANTKRYKERLKKHRENLAFETGDHKTPEMVAQEELPAKVEQSADKLVRDSLVKEFTNVIGQSRLLPYQQQILDALGSSDPKAFFSTARCSGKSSLAEQAQNIAKEFGVPIEGQVRTIDGLRTDAGVVVKIDDERWAVRCDGTEFTKRFLGYDNGYRTHEPMDIRSGPPFQGGYASQKRRYCKD